MKVAKAHGIGNDFLLVAEADAPAEIAPWARRLCDRHVGVGADGVLLHALAPDGVRMRLINADGGEAEISGNGLRCLAGYMVWTGSRPTRHVVHTGAGPRPVGVATIVKGVADRRLRVVCDGGTLDVEWPEGGHVRQVGDVEIVFEGEWLAV